MSKILLFDNYDSFTYNLLHILKELGAEVEVHRNDKISLEEVDRFDKILLSPGPGIPEEAGILLPLIRQYAPTKSILGVCLGEQAIGEAFGATLINLTDVHHGVCSDIRVTAKEPLFAGTRSRIPCRTLPLLGSLPRKLSRLPGNNSRRYGRKTNHGIASPYVRCPGYPVPSGIGPDPERQDYY